jgi:hypothetical protein
MKSTKARKLFKSRFGQANHFLITSLIGLYEIEHNSSIKKPDEFSTSWEPHDRVRSSRRSREFLLDSFLSHAVDGVDSYLTLLNKSPKPILDKDFELIFEKANRSVYKKVLGIHDYFLLDKTITGLILLLITWRNNLTHYFAENEILGDYENHLYDHGDEIKNSFRGLDIKLIIPKSYKGQPLTFKEVASLINATHLYVEKIDAEILNRINLTEYANRILNHHFDEYDGSLLKYQNLSHTERQRFEFNVLQNLGAFEMEDFKKIKNTP